MYLSRTLADDFAKRGSQFDLDDFNTLDDVRKIENSGIVKYSNALHILNITQVDYRETSAYGFDEITHTTSLN